MKSSFLTIVWLLFLSACASAVTQPSPTETPTAEITPTGFPITQTVPSATLPAATPSLLPNELPAMFLPIQKEIASNYGISPDRVKLVSSEAVEWRDSCLGVQQAGTACLDVITPGYTVFFETPQGKVEVHTNSDATIFKIVAPQTGIRGQAWVSPACPGPIKLGGECPDKPYQGGLQILNKDGSVAAEVITSAEGTFEISLPPGVYTVSQLPGTAIPALAPQEVTVAPGEFTDIELILDSGLR